MVNEGTQLKVRNLLSGRNNVDQKEGSSGGKGLRNSWIQDSTGRVTDESEDDPDVIQDDGHGEGFIVHTEEDAIPNNHPAIQFAETVPHYPIVFSCEHILLHPPVGQEIPMTDKRYDFFSPPPEAGSLLNVTNVPIILQLLLPLSIHGETWNADDLSQNVDAIEWSLLNLVADSTGLSKKCNISMQYDHHRSLFYKSSRLQRQLERHLESLPYPTGIYEIATDRESTKWKST
jgi:hypothetical protein